MKSRKWSILQSQDKCNDSWTINKITEYDQISPSARDYVTSMLVNEACEVLLQNIVDKVVLPFINEITLQFDNVLSYQNPQVYFYWQVHPLGNIRWQNFVRWSLCINELTSNISHKDAQENTQPLKSKYHLDYL